MLKFKDNKGITLVALIITIIIMLLLAGVAISQLTESGLFNKTRQAQKSYEISKLDANLTETIISGRYNIIVTDNDMFKFLQDKYKLNVISLEDNENLNSMQNQTNDQQSIMQNS